MITFEDFNKVEMCTATIIAARPNSKAIKPAYVLTLDLGALGTKTSSAQITQHYTCEDLIGQQVIVVVNFPPKKIADVSSEVLVLGVTAAGGGVILLQPGAPVANGMRVH